MNEKLRNLLNNSYSPFFNYPVSAVVVMKDGTEFSGVNVETTSPAAGTCAERNAIYSGFTQGYSKNSIKEIHIMSKTESECLPCFICRHTISDFCTPDTKIISHTYSGNTTTYTVAELCPHPFGEDNLK